MLKTIRVLFWVSRLSDIMIFFLFGKLECAAFGRVLLLEESGATLITISCNSWFFARGSLKVWFLNSGFYASGLDSFLFSSSPLEEAMKVESFCWGAFRRSKRRLFNCFSSSNAPDCLISLPLFHRPFTFFFDLGKVFWRVLLALCIVGSVEHWLRWLGS